MSYSMKKRALVTKTETQAGQSSDPLDKAGNYANPAKQDVSLEELSYTRENSKEDENRSILDGTLTGQAAIPGVSTGGLDFKISYNPGETYPDTVNVGEFIHSYPPARYLQSAGLGEVTIWDEAGAPALADYPYGAKRLYYPSLGATANSYTATVLEKSDDGVDGIANELIGIVNNLVINAESAASSYAMEFSGNGGVDSVFAVPAADLDKFVFEDDDVLKTAIDTYIYTDVYIKDNETGVETNFCSRQASLDLGNQITSLPCQIGGSGIKQYNITEFQPRMVLEPELQPLDVLDTWAGVTSTKTYTVRLVSHYKVAAGEISLEMWMPQAQLLSATSSDNDNTLYEELTFRPLKNVDAEIPVVSVLDAATGLTPVIWDGSNMTEFQKKEMMFAIIISEIVRQ